MPERGCPHPRAASAERVELSHHHRPFTLLRVNARTPASGTEKPVRLILSLLAPCYPSAHEPSSRLLGRLGVGAALPGARPGPPLPAPPVGRATLARLRHRTPPGPRFPTAPWPPTRIGSRPVAAGAVPTLWHGLPRSDTLASVLHSPCGAHPTRPRGNSPSPRLSPRPRFAALLPPSALPGTLAAAQIGPNWTKLSQIEPIGEKKFSFAPARRAPSCGRSPRRARQPLGECGCVSSAALPSGRRLRSPFMHTPCSSRLASSLYVGVEICL